jgi:hypothetical protein
MKAKLLIVVLIVFCIRAGVAQTWIYAASSTNGSKFYVKSTTVSQSNTIKVWTKSTGNITYKIDSRELKVPDGYDMCLYEFDCNTHRCKLYSRYTYDASGQVLTSYNFEEWGPIKWNDIVPDSVFEGVLEKVCELYN